MNHNSMKKVIYIIIFLLCIRILSFCNSNHHSKDISNTRIKDCNDLSSFTTITSTEFQDFEYDWKIEDIENPYYLTECKFRCNGKSMSGKVFGYDEEHNIITTGFLLDGKASGIWTDKNNGIIYEISFINIGKEAFIKDYRSFSNYNDEHIIQIHDSLYIDTVFSKNPSTLHSITWKTLPSISTSYSEDGNEILKYMWYGEDGNLTSYYLKDSVCIRWKNEIEKCMNMRNDSELKKGYRIEIVNNKPEWCLQIIPQEEDVLYTGKDAKGNYYTSGLFVHFDTYGKADSVFVNLDKNKLK